MISEPRITKVDVVDLGRVDSVPEDDRFAVVVRVADVAGWSGPINRLPAVVVREYLGELAVGHSVTDHRSLHRLCRTVLGAHDRGMGSWALGALDCAIWDLHARLAREPLAALLTSGPISREVPVYASWLSLKLEDPRAADEVAAVAAEKYAFTKWSLRRRTKYLDGPEGIAMAETVNKTAAASGGPIAADALGSWNLTTTMVFADHVDLAALRWLEDPLPKTVPHAYSELAARCTAPLGLGEGISGPDEAFQLLATLKPAALTIDVAWCGGITAALDVLALARSTDVPVYPHGRCFLPSLQLAAAFPDTVPAVEFQTQWEPRRQSLIRDRLLPVAGIVPLPDIPGVGAWPRSL